MYVCIDNGIYKQLTTILLFTDRYSLMLKCWEVDVDSRFCFEEIVIELNEEVSKGYVIETLDDDDKDVQMDSCYTVL